MSKSAALVKELSNLGIVGSVPRLEPENTQEERLQSDDTTERISALCESISDGFLGLSESLREFQEHAKALEELVSALAEEAGVLSEGLAQGGQEEEEEEEEEEAANA